MAKKDKNSLLNIHYSRTLTPDNLSKAANYVGEHILKGLGTFGKFLNAGFTSPTYGTIGQVSYARNAEDAKRQREQSEASEQAIGKAMTWVSPLNYGAAVWNGHGLDARKGEKEVASWSPAWQAVGRLGELYVGPKAVKGVKATPRAVVNTAAKVGVKPAKAAVVAREIKLGIKLNTKNGKIEVTEDYFNSPDKWYRITETPEKYGIMELGKNVTTHDASQIYGTINGWRSSILKAPITKSSEGFIKRPHKIEIGIRRKNGQAHGNTSQAAKGKLWGGTTSGSNLFPEGIIEGQAPSMINYGIDRTNFVMTPWELVPNGGRVGFHTGEMPMSNLGWFQRTNKGTYTYEPIIPEKRINFTPTKLLEPSKTSSTIQISPEELYKVLKGQELNGYYFMGHGTGRTGVNPQTIFDNGLRVKGGDIGNTTMPISESNLTSWPHMNSEEIILMPGKATMTKYDSAHGHIPSDWYSSDVFHWTDNPKKVGSGLFAAFEPNASFTEQTIGGVPGVYTKPEAVLGSYNTKTHTLKLNPKSLYEFLFNVPKLAEPRTSLAFFERKPAKNNIVGASYDYRMEDPKGSMDFLKLFFALLKINGKEYTLEGLRDAANVQQGLPEHIQSYLNLNTVERAVRAMRKNGYSEREIQLYIDKVNEEMNKVKVGMYSDLEYNAAGALDFGGFYNKESNFISVNRDAHLKDSKFTPEYIMKHEGRHLIDYNTSMTDDVINILEKAYDKDFLEIPKHEDAGSLKDYQHMDRERVTTNRDARDVLLTSKGKYLLNKHDFIIDSSKRGYSTDMIDFLNKIIKYAQPEDIVNAVENSNGYGKRYINYLKKNNKLTPAKIEQLRLAMIHVPSYLLPVAGGYTLYNIFNQPLQQLQYQKQGGKMNILEFLKKGSGIHIKEKNKGKFTSYCGGKVTDECILKGKNSSNPVIRKRATFAANARKWKHLDGGIIIAEKGIKAGLQAKQNLTKRKAPDWDNLDRGYRYLTQDMKLPHDLAIAIMGNVVEESQGNYKAVLKNGGGRGLIQWDGQPAPTGRYGLWGKIWASVAKPANVYDSKTDTMKNYWAPWGGLKGEQVRLKFINAPLKTKTKIYAESYLRPGKPRIKDRQLSAMLLDSVYNPRIKNIIINKEGGIIKAEEGTKTNWWSKIGNGLKNFGESKVGQSIISLGLSTIFRGGNSSNNDISKVAEDFNNSKLESINLLRLLNLEYAKNLLESKSDPDNPNANGGIFKDYVLGLINNMYYGELQKQQRLKEELLNQYKKDLETNKWMSIVQGAALEIPSYFSKKLA